MGKRSTFRQFHQAPSGHVTWSPEFTNEQDAEDWWHEQDREHHSATRPPNLDTWWEPDGTSARFRLDPLDETWVLEGTLLLVDGALTVTEMTVRPKEVLEFTDEGVCERPRRPEEVPAGGVTGALLRKIPMGHLLTRVRKTLLLLPEGPPDEPERIAQGRRHLRELAATLEATARDRAVKRRRGPQRYGDDHYRAVALAYIDIVNEAGTAKGVLKKVGQRLHCSPSTAGDWVVEARRRGFLAPTTPGRAEASPGPRLWKSDEEER